MWETIRTFLELNVAPLLQAGLEPIHAALNLLPPWSWRLLVCLFLSVGTLWGLFLNRSFIFAGAPSAAHWRDLRWWLLVLLLPYLIVYLLF